MGKVRHAVRPKSVRIEPWEIGVARSVASAFKTFPEHEDLEAELLKRMLELKERKRPSILDWRGFLAKSLYNAATDYIRRWSFRHRGNISLAAPLSNEDEAASLEDLLAAPEESLDLRIDLSSVMEELPAEFRELWHLLVEERGNMSSAARRIGRPKRTVNFWVGKIKSALKKRGFGEPEK